MSDVETLSKHSRLDHAEDDLLGSNVRPYITDDGGWCDGRCCSCLCKPTRTRDPMRNTLRDIEIERVVRTLYNQRPDLIQPPPHRNVSKTTDIESGYLSKAVAGSPKEEEKGRKTLEKIRRSSDASKSLPKPAKAIANANEKSMKMKARQKKAADDLEAVNRRMLDQVTKSPFTYTHKPDASSEQTSVFSIIGTDCMGHVLSQLVGSEAIVRHEGPPGKRRSIVHKQVTIHDPKPEKHDRRASVSYIHTSNNMRRITTSASISYAKSGKPEPARLKFLNKIVNFSTQVKKELEKDWNYTLNYIQKIEGQFTGDYYRRTRRKTTEHWMVLFYTTSDDDATGFTKISILLVRLLLQYHHVAYEERDVALKKIPYEEELRRRVGGAANVFVPSVFANGVSIGGSRVMYALHKLRKMPNIFEKFMLPGKLYDEWMQSKEPMRSGLNLNVPVAKYPTLNEVAMGSHIPLNRKDTSEVLGGKTLIVKLRKNWSEVARERHVSQNLLRYVLFRTTLALCFAKLNNLYARRKLEMNAQKRKFSTAQSSSSHSSASS